MQKAPNHKPSSYRTEMADSAREPSEVFSLNSEEQDNSYIFENKQIAEFLNQYGFSDEQDVLTQLETLGYSDEARVPAKDNFLKNMAIIAQDSDLRSLYSRFGFAPTTEAQHAIFINLKSVKKEILEAVKTRRLIKESLSSHHSLKGLLKKDTKVISTVIKSGSPSIETAAYVDVLYLMQATANALKNEQQFDSIQFDQDPTRYINSAIRQEYNAMLQIKEEAPLPAKISNSSSHQRKRHVDKDSHYAESSQYESSSTNTELQSTINLPNAFNKLFSGQSRVVSSRKVTPGRYTTQVEFSETGNGNLRLNKIC